MRNMEKELVADSRKCGDIKSMGNQIDYFKNKYKLYR
jgi:hypothetical protein